MLLPWKIQHWKLSKQIYFSSYSKYIFSYNMPGTSQRIHMPFLMYCKRFLFCVSLRVQLNKANTTKTSVWRQCIKRFVSQGCTTYEYFFQNSHICHKYKWFWQEVNASACPFFDLSISYTEYSSWAEIKITNNAREKREVRETVLYTTQRGKKTFSELRQNYQS